MYLDYFGLQRDPFHITPDPFFFYFSPSHKESLASLIYGLKNRKGFIALTGEVGLGKTTLVRSFLNKWSHTAKIKTIFVFNSNLSFKALLLNIFEELGLEALLQDYSAKEVEQQRTDLNQQDQVSELVRALHSALIQEYEQGYNVILVIDEAQNMPVQTLENLRMLSNLETSSDKLLQIFLIGQTELDKTLNLQELRQLRQRIAVRATLQPLNKKQSKDYIQYRLKKAGAEGKKIFTRASLRKISKYAQGVPRRINILADNAMITAFGYGRHKISAKIIKEVYQDMKGRNSRPKLKLALAAISVLVLLGPALWLSPYRTHIVSGLEDIIPRELLAVAQVQQESAVEIAAPHEAANIMQSPATTAQPEAASVSDPPGGENDLAVMQDKPQKTHIKEIIPPSAKNVYPLPAKEMDSKNKYIHYKLTEEIPVYVDLSRTRQAVLMRMAKQTTIDGLLSFKRMLAALEQENYQEAARQMLHSRWADKVGQEAEILAETMRINQNHDIAYD